MPQPAAVKRHYAREGLAEQILEALRAAGLDPDRLTVDDLAPVDEFHIRGRTATEELAALAEPARGQRLLDVGCGLGGTARYLAARIGVEVVGVDLTPEYCRLGSMLTERVGLADRIEFRAADALELPFGDGSFDQIWTEHLTMNIADKPRLFRQLRRVARVGGRLAFHEVVAGPGGEIHFPVPWAPGPEISFLVPADELRATVERGGWRVLAWRDATAPALTWFRQRAAALAGTPPTLGFHLLLGADARPMFANQVRNLAECRIALVQAVAEAS